LFDDAQWTINADALTWAEDNFDALSNTEMFGGSPREGDVYGYSGWTDNKGIIGFRNPSTEEKVYEIKLDSSMGIKNKENTYYRSTVYPYGETEDGPYKYGDTIEVTLEPHDAYIWQFESKEDLEAPVIVDVKAHDKNHIQVTYDERVEQASAENINNYAINEDISIEGAELGEDYRTVTLSVSDLEKGIEYELTTENVKDMANYTSGLLTVNFYRHDDGTVVHWDILDDDAFISD